VEDALCAFTATETINGGEFTKSVRFQEMPHALVITLQRFSYDATRGAASKIKKELTYPNELRVDPAHLAPECQSRAYELLAVLCHTGLSIDSGHYYALVRYDDSWYLYDDEIVSKVSAAEVAKRTYDVYILIYANRSGKVSFLPSSSTRVTEVLRAAFAGPGAP